MPWIESHTVLMRHRKVLFLAHALAIPPVHVVGHLHAFWHAVLEQQEDGDLTEWPTEMIAQAAGWNGDAERFVSAMRTHGWIDDHLVHDWLDYAGKFLHSKYSTSNPSKLKSMYDKHGYNYGKGKGKYGKVKAQSKRKVSANKAQGERDNLLPNQPIPNQPIPNQEEFELFWKVYPKKVGKNAALQAWRKAKDRPGIDFIVRAIDTQLHSQQWVKEGGQFIPNPSTWLNQGRWNDEPARQITGVKSAPIPPFPGPEDPIGRSLWRKAYGQASNV